MNDYFEEIRFHAIPAHTGQRIVYHAPEGWKISAAVPMAFGWSVVLVKRRSHDYKC